MSNRKTQICFVVTAAVSFMFRQGQFRFLRENGFEVTAVSAPGPTHEQARREGANCVAIPMEREMAPWADLQALRRLYNFFCRHRFDIIVLATPKASLLGALAARLAGQPRVIYNHYALYYQTMPRCKRALFRNIDRLICSLSNRVLPINHELARWLPQHGTCPANKIRTIGSGSSNGVDTKRFSRTPELCEAAGQIRKQWNIPGDALVIGSVARLVVDKGIEELVAAFVELAKSYENLYLMLVGPYETAHLPNRETIQAIENHPRIRHVGFQNEIEKFYAAMDIFALPTYREGFGKVFLEAAAMELPVVGSDIMGCRESIAANVTGLTVKPQDVQSLKEALAKFVRDGELRRKFGSAGRQRVKKYFRPEIIWNGNLAVYRDLMRSVPYEH